MKTIEELEKQLRTWTPCRPSDRLRVKIFGRPAAAPRWGWNLTRLAFASAAGLAMVFALHHLLSVDSSGSKSGYASRSKSSYAMLAAALSNQTLVAYMSPQANQEWNRPSATYQVSNLGELLLPASFVRQGRTNR